MNVFFDGLPAFWDWLLQSTLQACVLVCVIRLIQLALRKRLAARWHYALWLLLVARMVMPFAPESSVSLFNLFSYSQAPPAAPSPSVDVGEESASLPVLAAMPEPAGLSLDALLVEREVSGDSTAASTPAVAAESALWARVRGAGVWPLAWLAGVALLLAYVLRGSVAMGAKLRRAPTLEDARALAVLDACREAMGVRARIQLVATKAVPSPALFGLWRPRMIFPEGLVESLTDAQLRHVMLHELAHYKRRDLPVNCVMSFLQILHWFNPLVAYAFYRMRVDRELACDALALSYTEPDESRAYGLTILELMENQTRFRRYPSMVGIIENHTQLKRRISAIALFRKNSYRWSALAVALLVGLGGLLLTDARAVSEDGAAKEEIIESLEGLGYIGSKVAQSTESEPVMTQILTEEIISEDGKVRVQTTTTSSRRGARVRPIRVTQINASSDASYESRVVMLKHAGVDDVKTKLDALMKGTPGEGGVNVVLDADSNTMVLYGPEDLVGEYAGLAARLDGLANQGSSKLNKVLQSPVTIVFEDIHLSSVVDFLSDTYEMNIVLDYRVFAPEGTLERANGSFENPEVVTTGIAKYVSLKQVHFQQALEAILEPMNLDYVVRKDYIWISSVEKLRSVDDSELVAARRMRPARTEAQARPDMEVGWSPSSSDIAWIEQRIARNREIGSERVEASDMLKQMGIVFKMFANESMGERFPALSPVRGAFRPEAERWYTEYVTDERIAMRLRGQDAIRWAYLGYAVTDSALAMTLLDAIEKQGAEAISDREVVVEEGLGLNGGDKVMQLREGVQRYFITDINNPAGSALAKSQIPILWEMPEGRKNSGGFVLYMDGHVEWRDYPGAFPMEPKFIERLEGLMGEEAAGDEE